LFTSNTSFNLAHWIFAFSYLVLSYRLELIAKGLPEGTHNCRLKAVNILVCLFNLAIPALYWVYYIKREKKAATITTDVE
jgi:hypothetical protein